MKKNNNLDKSKINLNILNDSILKGELEIKKVKEQHQMMRTPKNKAKILGKDFYFDFNIDSSASSSSLHHPSSHRISSSPSNLRKNDVNSKNLILDYQFQTDKKATDVMKKQVDLLYQEFEKSESEQFQKDLSNLTPSNRSEVYDSSKKKDSNKLFASPFSRGSNISSSSSDDCFFNTFNVNGRNQTLLEAEFLRDKENLVDHAVVEGMPIGFIDMLKSLEFLNSDLILEIQTNSI